MGKMAGSFKLGAGHSRRASVLIVALGVLTVLALLAFVFTSLSRVERDVAKSYVDQTKAKMLAQAGIEKACLDIRSIAFAQAYEELGAAWSYKRFVDNGPNNGRYDVGEQLLPAGAPQYDYSDLELSPQPSFCEGLITVEGQQRGYSGRLASSYPDVTTALKSVDAYSLKVIDCASQIYINGPTEIVGGVRRLTAGAKMMLNTLGLELPQPISGLGDTISANLPAGGYVLKSQLASPSILGVTNYNKVKDYITAHAWVDPKTINPAAVDPVYNGNKAPYNQPGMVTPNDRWVYDKANRTYAGCGCADHMNGAKNQYYPYEQATEPASYNVGNSGVPLKPLLEPRAPININTASRAVLVAVLYNVAGGYLDRTRPTGTLDNNAAAKRNAVRPGYMVPYVPATPQPNTFVDLTTARNLADQIILFRATSRFTSWMDFSTFIEPRANWQIANLLKANSNSNSDEWGMHYNKAIGYSATADRRLRFGSISKANLEQWTTEFCFSSMGFFNIESVGMVTVGDKIMAQSKITTVAKVYDVMRHTTQYDFQACQTSLNRITTFPEKVANFPTWADVKYNGLGRYSDIDGNVQLALDDDNPGGQVTFRADFTTDLNAEESTGGSANAVAKGPANDGYSAFDYGDPSELRPDGYFSHEANRYPYTLASDSYQSYMYGSQGSQFGGSWDEYLRYNSVGNLPVSGTIEMWLKPTWDSLQPTGGQMPEGGLDISDSRAFFTCGLDTEGWRYPSSYTVNNRFVIFYRGGLVNFQTGNNIDGANSYFSRPMNYPDRYAGIRGSYVGANAVFFGKASCPVSWKAGEWHHIAAVWDQNQAWIYADGVKCANILDRLNLAPSSGLWNGGNANWSMHIGTNRFLTNWTNGYPLSADCTMDNIRIYSSINKFQAGGFPCPDRYKNNGQLQMGLFPANQTGSSTITGTLGCVSWTLYMPVAPAGGYSAMGLNVNSGAGVVDVPAINGSGSAALNLPFSSLNGVQYTITLRPPNQTPCVETPILDDITLTYATGETKYFFWSME